MPLLLALANGCAPRAKVYITEGQPGSIDASYYRQDVEASDNPHSVAGVTYLKVKNWQEAARAFRQAIQENPGDHRSMFGLGVALQRLGDRQAAMSQFEQAVVLTQSREQRYVMALGRLKST